MGEFVAGALCALTKEAPRRNMWLGAYAVTLRGRGSLDAHLPPGVNAIAGLMPARPLHAAWRAAGLPRIEHWTGPLDVVHGTNYVVPPARRAARVVSVHDMAVVRFPELCDPATLVFAKLVRRALRGGAWVQTPSKAVAEEVIDVFSADPGMVRVVPYGVPTERSDAAESAGEAGLSHESREPGTPHEPGKPHEPGTTSALGDLLPAGTSRYVLALGRVEPRKDLTTLVSAFGAIAAARSGTALVVAGPDGWGTEAFEQARRGSACPERIVRVSSVSDELRELLLANASAFAYPSIYEGFGFPPLEAMATGVPVVATDTGSLPEVLGDAALLVPTRDKHALAEALAAILDDTKLADNLAQRGRERASLFTWQACAAGLADLYQDASAAMGGTRP